MKLTPEQRARIPEHLDKWLECSISTEPADWELFTDAARRCYEHAGIPWHGNVVRVSSPLVLSLAAPTAAYLLATTDKDGLPRVSKTRPTGEFGAEDLVREILELTTSVDTAVTNAVHDAVGPREVQDAHDMARRTYLDNGGPREITQGIRQTIGQLRTNGNGSATRAAIARGLNNLLEEFDASDIAAAVSDAVGEAVERFPTRETTDRASQTGGASAWAILNEEYRRIPDPDQLNELLLNIGAGLRAMEGIHAMEDLPAAIQESVGQIVHSLTPPRIPSRKIDVWADAEVLDGLRPLSFGQSAINQTVTQSLTELGDRNEPAGLVQVVANLTLAIVTEVLARMEFGEDESPRIYPHTGGRSILSDLIGNVSMVVSTTTSSVNWTAMTEVMDALNGRLASMRVAVSDTLDPLPVLRAPETDEAVADAEVQRLHAAALDFGVGVQRYVTDEWIPSTNGETADRPVLAAGIIAAIAAESDRLAADTIQRLSGVGLALETRVARTVQSLFDGTADRALIEVIRHTWHHRLWGNLWPYWQAYNSFFRDVCDLELDGDLWERSRAFEDTAMAAGWWWPHRDFTMVCDRPAELHLEQIDGANGRAYRLHNANGPAIAWRDGYALHFWHGIRVPADLIEGDGWSVEQILNEPNTEIRRCAIERIGWDTFITQAGLRPIHECPDPGNPGQHLQLYDLPIQPHAQPVRLLLASNGTPEPDGTRRRFGLTVPARISRALHAAAWMADDPESPWAVTPEVYAELARRT